MKHQDLLPIFVAAAIVSLASGCGGATYQPVTGQLVFTDGAPVQGLQGGRVTAQLANGATDAKIPSGPIDADGKFTLGTDGLGDGAPEGEYQLLITLPESTGDVPLPRVIDPKYTRPGGFTKTFPVKTGKNEWKVEVERASVP